MQLHIDTFIWVCIMCVILYKIVKLKEIHHSCMHLLRLVFILEGWWCIHAYAGLWKRVSFIF